VPRSARRRTSRQATALRRAQARVSLVNISRSTQAQGMSPFARAVIACHRLSLIPSSASNTADQQGAADMPIEEKNPHRDTETSPTRSVHHDVLVINPNQELYRFNVRKTDVGRVGEYLSVDYLGAGASGHRKVMHVARKGTNEHARGAAFATLPVKDEPASSYVCCYLINAKNLNYRNVWTQAEWNDAPEDGDEQTPSADARDRDIRFLIAEHGGRVLYLDIPKEMLPRANEGWVLSPANGATPNLQAIDLKTNPEIWNLLRNGCVAGSADYRDMSTPLANLTSLVPFPEQQHTRRKDVSDRQITGTLDFKWPRRPNRDRKRSDIVVAFLPLRNNSYRIPQRALFERFEAIARRWLSRSPGIRVEFETALAFDAYDPIDYDILVSLEPLGPDVLDEQGRPVTIPQAELGNYARRVDRGVATLFAGMPEGLLKSKGLLKSDDVVMAPEEYPESRAFQHFVVHEFGHALGLLHLHQSPELNETALNQLHAELGLEQGDDRGLDREVKQLMKERLGITVPDDYVEEAIRGRWPGNAPYSEWPTYNEPTRADAVRAYLQDSIMIGLAAHAKGRMADIQPSEYLTKPSEGDLDWIELLYPPRTIKSDIAELGGSANERREQTVELPDSEPVPSSKQLR
jgi:hypothetical protein